MRISDGTETMEVSVKEYGDHSDKEITDRALPQLVDWAETPGIVRNVRRTSHRLMELFANDGADARTILGHTPYGMKLGLSIRLHAPDIQDDERGLPGEHLGNARIISCTNFGGYDDSPWSWLMFSKLVDVPAAELKELFPVAAKNIAEEYEMYLYEITPISDDELLRNLFADPEKQGKD